MANICSDLGELAQTYLKSMDQAQAFYNEAIQYVPSHSKSLAGLAKLFKEKGDYAAAQTQCSNMIKLDVALDQATMIMADLSFLSKSYDEASSHFKIILKENPCHYSALERYLDIMKRHGKLQDAPTCFTEAEAFSSKTQMHAGYHYCKGLYLRYSLIFDLISKSRYTNSVNDALKEFVQCRKDREWGDKSMENMIELFLNPENDIVGGEALASRGSKASLRDDNADQDLLVLLTADKLVKVCCSIF